MFTMWDSRKVVMGETGFSMMELVVVIVIMGILSLVAMRNISKSDENARFQATIAEIGQLEQGIVGNKNFFANGFRVDFGYVGSMGVFPTSLTQLKEDQGTPWNGPYVSVNFQDDPNSYLNDAWGDPYQWAPAELTLYSPGNGDGITKVIGGTGSTQGDFLNNTIAGTFSDRNAFTPTVTELASISILVNLTNGSTINGTTQSGGAYTITGVPIGNHKVQAVYSTTGENVIRSVCVVPKSNSIIDIVFSTF